MKKCSGLIILSVLVAITLASMASPAFASTRQTAVLTSVQEKNVQDWDQWGPGWSSSHDVNQSFCGRNFSGLTTIVKGRNQGNFGNSGTNEGFNQDNNANGGNQFIHIRDTNGPLRINQFNCGVSNTDNHSLTVGEDQENTGNSGLNSGFNQDNGLNAGNQIIN